MSRCTATVRLYDRAALDSRTQKSEAVKAEIQCTLQEGHDTNHGAVLGDSEPKGAILVWSNES